MPEPRIVDHIICGRDRRELGYFRPGASKGGADFSKAQFSAIDRCRVEEPQMENSGDGHEVSCHRWRELAGAEVA